jgi:predicted enzyme related to lactoylglutathione lyase
VAAKIACIARGIKRKAAGWRLSPTARRRLAFNFTIAKEHAMPEAPSSNPRQFIQGVPVLHVQDVAATVAFYRDVLGFTCDFGDESYAVVWRDNSAVHFVKETASPQGVHLFQWVKDIDGYYEEILRRGADVTTKPTNRPYGIREFGLTDVNGVSIVFGQDIDAE